jgi:hypothetical protein
VPVVPPVPVVMIVVQVPLVQVWPEVQAWPQLPQLLLFEVVSMQLPLQSCWPLTVQVQVPPLQDEPLPQAVQLVPQWAASVFELQAPSEHIMLPAPHPVDEHWPLLQTCPLLHLLPQLPQLSVLEATHEPLQESSPPEQAQAPFWQVLPLPHAFPQAPQFWLSFCVFTHDPLHSVWLELQEGPVPPVPLVPLVPPVPVVVVAGLAQLATKNAEAKRVVRTQREALRESMF